MTTCLQPFIGLDLNLRIAQPERETPAEWIECEIRCCAWLLLFELYEQYRGLK